MVNGIEVGKAMGVRSCWLRTLVRSMVVMGCLLWVGVGLGWAQGGTAHGKPPKPKLVSLTVTKTGAVVISYQPASTLQYYTEPIGVRIYCQDTVTGDYNLLIDIPNAAGHDNKYTHTDAKANLRSRSYKLTSFDAEGKDSEFTDMQRTLFLKAEYDECGRRIKLMWDLYLNMSEMSKLGKEVTNGDKTQRMVYAVYRGASDALEGTLPHLQVSDEEMPPVYDTLIASDITYYYMVKMLSSDPALESSSNVIKITTKDLRQPSILTIDSVFSFGGYNQIHFRIDEGKHVVQYQLVRRDDTTQGPTTWVEIAKSDKPLVSPIEDRNDPENIHLATRYYQLISKDMCEEESMSRHVNSLSVRSEAQGDRNMVRWNPIVVPAGSRVEYEVFRADEHGEFKEHPVVTLSSELGDAALEYYDDVSASRGLDFRAEYCYWVEAREISTYTLKGEKLEKRTTKIKSVPTCSYKKPPIVLPTGIAPQDGGIPTNGLKRNQFAPLISAAASYKVFIYNRAGALIFNGNRHENQPWEGKDESGQYVPEGPYLYRVELYAPGAPSASEMGTVMVVYPAK